MHSLSHRNRFRPHLEAIEERAVPAAWSPIPDGTVVVAPEDGGVPKVHLMDPVTGKEVRQITTTIPDGFRGGIHAELGDVTGDGVPDLVYAPGNGGGPRVTVIDGATGDVVADFLAYEGSFRGGVDVAVGDANGDGFADVLTGTGTGGGPRITVIDGKSLTQGGNVVALYNFFPYEDSFRGGVFVGTGDVNGDGFSDIIAGTGVGGGSRVEVFDGKTGDLIQNFFAFDPANRTGVRVGAADVDGDGDDDVLAGAGPNGGPRVQVFSGKNGQVLEDIFADDPSARGGVHVGGVDLNGDGTDDLVTQTRHGNSQQVHIFNKTGTDVQNLSADVDDNPAG